MTVMLKRMSVPKAELKQGLIFIARNIATIVWVGCALFGFMCLGAFPITLGHAALSAWQGDLPHAAQYLGGALRALLIAVALLMPVVYVYRWFGRGAEQTSLKVRLKRATHGQFGPHN
ncbi:hypothetical protein [Deinococcus sp. QL22]|uniref:hypothetical protein n=1 Tax=Deinococcus sp. QL22 TaxID=2939437 RepID=UPI0020179B58|nr:hypothetical protein [Deinococcus sp. QL22]UQN08323.1 hypothetical protein M1R55_16450 [Deinococcus sp. QL22]